MILEEIAVIITIVTGVIGIAQVIIKIFYPPLAQDIIRSNSSKESERVVLEYSRKNVDVVGTYEYQISLYESKLPGLYSGNNPTQYRETARSHFKYLFAYSIVTIIIGLLLIPIGTAQYLTLVMLTFGIPSFLLALKVRKHLVDLDEYVQYLTDNQIRLESVYTQSREVYENNKRQ